MIKFILVLFHLGNKVAPVMYLDAKRISILIVLIVFGFQSSVFRCQDAIALPQN